MADINLGCKGCKLTQKKKKKSVSENQTHQVLAMFQIVLQFLEEHAWHSEYFPHLLAHLSGNYLFKYASAIVLARYRKPKHNKLMRPMKRWNWGNERGLMERGEDIVSKRIHKRYSKHNPNSKIWYCWSSKFCYVTFLFQILAVFISNNSESLKISVKELRCV